MLFSWFVTKMLVYSAAFVNDSSFSSRGSASAIYSRRLCRESRFTMSGRCGRLFVRQAGGEAIPLPAPVHNRAAGGSLSSGPWNKCLACGSDLNIHLFLQLYTYPSFYPFSDIHLFLHLILHVFIHIEAISNFLPIFLSNIFSIFVMKGIVKDSTVFVVKVIAKLSTITAYSQILDRKIR